MTKTVLLATISLLLATTCQRKTRTTKSLGDLEQLLSSAEEQGLSGSVLLMEKDSTLYYRGMGFADQVDEVKNSVNTIYPFGSIVKDYTKALIFQAVLAGRLKTDQTLKEFFSDVPDDKADISIAQLVQHRSGLASYHDLGLEEGEPNIPADLQQMTRDKAVEIIFKTPLKLAPGEDYRYSNSGYTLLALILEKVTSKTFENLCEEQIFQAAEMDQTDFYSSPKWKAADVAVGYGSSSYGVKNSPYYWPRNPMPIFGNGGIAGTLEDLYRSTKYLQNMRANNSKLEALYQQFRDEQEPPTAGLVGSAGGNDLGFVAVTFGKLDTDQYMLFASNNSADGVEDIDLLRRILIHGFGFDLAEAVPNAFEDDVVNSDYEYIAKGDSQWGLPGGKRWLSVESFLNTIDALDPEQVKLFLSESISSKYKEKYNKQEHQEKLEAWHQGAPFEVEMLVVENEEVTIGLVDSGGKSVTFVVYLSRASKPLIDAIKLKSK
ncbi:MAG: beta-lactamase family protein [Saprospiraceae bacterium]|nr:beta-lactamase family protein [Saprospiraceae bacterium]